MPKDDHKSAHRPAERSSVPPKRRNLTPNSVEVLDEFCMFKGFPSPSYFLESQSHSGDSLKTFYMSCNVQDLQEFGAGRTTNIAKQRAAEAMWEQLDIRINAETLRMIE